MVTAYFFWIWFRCRKRDSENPLQFSAFNEELIHYSLFLIGVFGLSWSKYGLIAAETNVIKAPYMQIQDASARAPDNDHSWSSLGGWIKYVYSYCWKRKNAGDYPIGWLWLAAMSFLPFVALPLSGLCFELSEGYVHSSEHPMVLGRRLENFNERQHHTYAYAARRGWENGSPPTVPGFGLIYTPETIERSKYSSLDKVPNILPLDEGIPEIFLPAQARNPISGTSWGLRTSYNCSIVEDVSEFTILTQKSEATAMPNNTDRASGIPYNTLRLPSNQTIYTFSGLQRDSLAVNIFGYGEIGVENRFSKVYDSQEPESTSFDLGNTDKADILEYALWQLRRPASYYESPFNETVAPSVKGLGQPWVRTSNGTHGLNSTFFKVKEEGTENISAIATNFLFGIPERAISIAPPIGVRCRVLSSLGTADLDPARSTFRSFKPTPAPPFNQSKIDDRFPRFGNLAAQAMRASYLQIFTSVTASAPIAVSNSDNYQNFVRPQSLRRSIMQAYGIDALQLMYDGIYDFSDAWESRDLTSSKEGKVLSLGIIPPAVVAALFLVWALGCLGSGIAVLWSHGLW